MNTSVYSTFEIVKKLKKADELLESGVSVSEIVLQLGVTKNDFYKWQRQFPNRELSFEDDNVKLLEGQVAMLKAKVESLISENEALRAELRGYTGSAQASDL